MKTRWLFLALTLWTLSMLPLSAQFTAGAFINLNVAGLHVSPAGSGEDYSSYLGVGLGGIITYPLTNGFSLQGEPGFLQKGGKVTEFDQDFTIKLLYIDVPVFLRYDIALDYNYSFLPYVIAGPNFGIRASAKVKLPDGSNQDAGDEFSGIDFGLGFGAGVEVPYSDVIFFGETRYTFGLNNINKESDESKVRNRGLQILLGVKVPIKERSLM